MFLCLGIAGFARLCPGDVFEIVVRHGVQKWKSRGMVNKDATQTWDHEACIFKGLLGDILHVKVKKKTKKLGFFNYCSL